MRPAAPQLSWDDIVNYAFLADFDILRCARQDVREKPWANPTNRILRDQFFKLQRAQEEIKRLNIEIRRVITYMQDEGHFLEEQESLLVDTKPELAHQIALYRREHGRSNSLHTRRFEKLAICPSFTGDLSPGVPTVARATLHNDAPISMDSDNANDASGGSNGSNDSNDSDNDSDNDDDDDDHIVEDITYALLAVSLDEDLVVN